MNLYEALESSNEFVMVHRAAAVAIGLNEAIALKQLQSIAKTRRAKERNGKWWVPNTWQSWKDAVLPFWSIDTIRRTFRNLESMGLVDIEEEFHDGTQAVKCQWFAPNEGAMREIQCGGVVADCNEGSLQSATTQELIRDKEEKERDLSDMEDKQPESDEDDGYQEVTRAWEKITGIPMSLPIAKDLSNMVNTYGVDEMIVAIRITAESAGKPNINYLRSVLTNRALREVRKPEAKAYPNNPGDRPLGFGLTWEN